MNQNVIFHFLTMLIPVFSTLETMKAKFTGSDDLHIVYESMANNVNRINTASPFLNYYYFWQTIYFLIRVSA